MNLALVALIALLAASSPKDVTADYDVADGLEVKVWAESPQLHNPTNIDVDRRGRVWVAEGVNYRFTIKKDLREKGFVPRDGGDRIVILEDTDGDGDADTSKVFVQDKDLQAPLGIAVIGDKVVVSCSPRIIVYTDADGDDKPEKKEIFLDGFGGIDHDHGVHAFSFGPDGRWYFNAGNHGPHVVKDRAGFTLRTTKEGPGPGGEKSDDGRVWVQGVAMRINSDGTGLRVLAHNFRNVYELGLDAFGNLWQNDNDDDGNAGCRMSWLMEGGSYGYTSQNGRRGWRVDQRFGQSTQVAHWHQEDPGTVPPTEVTGPGSPTGLVVYEGHALPSRFMGAVLNADAGRSSVWAHRVKPAGAGYTSIERINFMTALASRGDEARRFRPSDVAVGTDGSVFIADWYDPIVGGHGMADKESFGRIFRVVPKGGTLKPAKYDLGAGAVEALLSPAVNVRADGWQALQKQGPAGIAAARKRFAAEKDPRARARLLWFLAAAKQAEPGKALRDRDADIRITAFRALRAHADPKALVKHASALVGDASPAVRREVAIALRDVPVADSGTLLLKLAQSYRPGDRTLLEAIGTGMDGKEAALWPTLLAKLGAADPLRWSPAFADLAWRLHPEASVPGLAARVHAAALPMPERQRALVALAFVPSRAAADAVVKVAETAQEPLKGYALDLAFDRATDEWRDFGVADHLKNLRSKEPDTKESRETAAWKAMLRKPGATRDEQGKAIEALAATGDGGNHLIGMAAQGKLPKELQDAVAESIFRNPDVGVRALASQYFKRPAFEGSAFPSVPELLKMKGDAARGKTVFFGERAACSRCHEYAGQGGNIGPSLSQIAIKLGREALLDSVLNPSAAIAFGYEPWVISTKDQQTYAGFVVGDGETVLLKELTGETRMIPASTIAQRQKEKTSFMPDNIALGMKPQELVDLIEFLASTPAAAIR